jgi:hypothetical protein
MHCFNQWEFSFSAYRLDLPIGRVPGAGFTAHFRRVTAAHKPNNASTATIEIAFSIVPTCSLYVL